MQRFRKKRKDFQKRGFYCRKVEKKIQKCKSFGIVVTVPVRRKNGMSHLCCMINAVKKNKIYGRIDAFSLPAIIKKIIKVLQYSLCTQEWHR
ncbi:hypothetical protein GDO78_023270 [Eleutherodactylus coqui]|uniref:Uncharacterized protein n=1 Tax=Eleutherodactylus coqui TaxID=57060 RepID=A0A8J6BC65_ELECQ|nr:hypothetical protein GDO78_023270 [Eleutherodactylus coqui]